MKPEVKPASAPLSWDRRNRSLACQSNDPKGPKGHQFKEADSLKKWGTQKRQVPQVAFESRPSNLGCCNDPLRVGGRSINCWWVQFGKSEVLQPNRKRHEVLEPQKKIPAKRRRHKETSRSHGKERHLPMLILYQFEPEEHRRNWGNVKWGRTSHENGEHVSRRGQPIECKKYACLSSLSCFGTERPDRGVEACLGHLAGLAGSWCKNTRNTLPQNGRFPRNVLDILKLQPKNQVHKYPSWTNGWPA